MQAIYINSDDTQIWTCASGQGLSVMLCNGGPGCCDYLGPVAELLDDVAQVIRFEQRGCGRSEPIPPYDLQACISDLENIRRAYELEQWVIGGHSWGADLALAYALEHPERVLGIICIAGGRINNDREWSKEYHRRKEEEGEELPVYDYPPNMEVNAAGNASWREYIQRPYLLQELAQLDVPTLFVYGDKDIRPSWPVEQVANLMPQATYKSVAGAKHYIWFTHAEMLKDHLRLFISSLS